MDEIKLPVVLRQVQTGNKLRNSKNVVTRFGDPFTNAVHKLALAQHLGQNYWLFLQTKVVQGAPCNR